MIIVRNVKKIQILILILFLLFGTFLILKESGPETAKGKIPKIIWSYWDNEEIPHFVKQVAAGWKDLNRDHEVRFLTPSTISKYLTVTLPNYFDEKDIIPQHRADWIRLALLKEYGGIWLDSSVITTQSLAFVHRKQQRQQSEGYAFFLGKFTRLLRSPFVETWFISTIAKGKLITAWFNEYDKVFRLFNGSDLYLDHLKKNYGNEAYARMVQGMDSPSYLKLNMAFQKVIQVDKMQTFFCEMAELPEYGGYQLQHRFNWDTNQLISSLLNDWEGPIPPIIKLRGFERTAMMAAIASNPQLPENSLYARFVRKHRV